MGRREDMLAKQAECGSTMSLGSKEYNQVENLLMENSKLRADIKALESEVLELYRRINGQARSSY